jgi:drug/metabolite transporter (DMT)-like permease
MPALVLALTAAILFGASTPANKLLLGQLHPVQLAGLLYLGAALGMVPVVARERRDRNTLPLSASNRWRLVGVIVLGGIAGPVLLLAGLRMGSATAVSLLLNIEPAATAVLGVMIFHEHLTRPGAFGVVGVVLAGVMLSWGEGGLPGIGGALVAAACICWALDNHLMALIDGLTPSRSTMWKSGVAGVVNMLIGLTLAPLHASRLFVISAVAVGALSYGGSLVLFITAAQQLGPTRAQGVFASAPFVGAGLSLLILGEQVTNLQAAASVVLLASIIAVLRSGHEHGHAHQAGEHIHSHRHDDGHHVHAHPGLTAATSHTHAHGHEPVVHAHPHWPDLHHRHSH